LNTRTSTYQSQINFFVKPLQNQESPSKKCANAYTYGFNGIEKDDEVKGSGNHYSFGDYGYDPRIVRRWNVDPMTHKLPDWSPYAAFANNPIIYVDVNGLYPIYIITRSYAPFKTFGVPGDEFYGDNRGHTLDKGASYRTLASINYDTETQKTQAFGGRSRSHNVRGTKDAISQTHVKNRSKGNNIDVHSYGNNAAQAGSWDIDQFTKIKVTTEGDIKTDHILNITGAVSGDDFPNQESMIYDSQGNTLWLGNYATSGNSVTGPTMDLANENESDVHININLRIKVNKDGVFQGVMQKGKDGKETMISIDDWNKQYKPDEKK
jgi:RHS repeat-associated protein